MRKHTLQAVVMLTTYLAFHGAAGAQLSGTNGRRTNVPRDSGTGGQRYRIKRRTEKGDVKSLDPQKQTLVMVVGKGEQAKEVPVDIGPSIIQAGKGSARFEDIRVGDRIRVYGEETVQRGLRAMEVTLPPDRMTIPPPPRPDKKRKGEPREKPEKERAGPKSTEKHR